MNIIKVNINNVINWDKNPRAIVREDFERLKKQIRKLGIYKPMIAYKEGDKYVVLGGNMRLRALKDLGYKEVDISIVPPYDGESLTESQKLEYSLSDNDRAGYYTEQELSELLFQYKDDIALEDYKVDLNFDPVDLSEVIDNVSGGGETIEDEPPPLPDQAKTKLGDLYILGNHRLLCGDSTKKEDVDRLLDGNKIDMVFTDPPYGVSYADKNKFLNKIDRGNRIQKEIKFDHLPEEDICELWLNVFESIRDNLAEINSYYITGPQIQGMMMMMMMMKARLPYRHVIIWVKNNHVLGMSDYNYRHEPLFFGWTTKHKFYGKGEFKTSVWEVDKPLKNDLHPTMKPIRLIINALLNSSLENHICYDPFGGSGSTMIACEQTNRKCYMMEIDPLYCDVIVERWEKFTGQEAKLSTT